MSIYDNDRVLGSLRERDPETYRALVEWHRAGKPVEVFWEKGWEEDEGRLHDHLTYRAVYEPPTPEEVERLRRKVVAGEKLAKVQRSVIECGLFLPYSQEALREWEAADD